MSIGSSRPTTNLVPVARAAFGAGFFARFFAPAAATMPVGDGTGACCAEAPAGISIASAAIDDIQQLLNALLMAMPWTPN
jgi:hypothetical protein